MSADDKRDIFTRLYDKKSYTGMYAERFAVDDPIQEEEEEAAHAFELRPSMNIRIQSRERLAASPYKVIRPKLKPNATVFVTRIEHHRTNCGHGLILLRFTGGRPAALLVSDILQTRPWPRGGKPCNHPVSSYLNVFLLLSRVSTCVQLMKPMLESRNFVKMMQDCPGLLDGERVTTADLDIVFVKCKAKAERRISFDQFLLALSHLAGKAFPDDADVPRTAFTLFLTNFLLRNTALAKAAEEIGEKPQVKVRFKLPEKAAGSHSGTATSSPAGSPRGGRMNGRKLTPFIPRRNRTVDAVDDGGYGGGGDSEPDEGVKESPNVVRDSPPSDLQNSPPKTQLTDLATVSPATSSYAVFIMHTICTTPLYVRK